MRDENMFANYTPSEIIRELEASIEEAIDSGSRQWPEHHGFDHVIYYHGIEPLLKHAKATPEYKSDAGFKNRIDSIEQTCERELLSARWCK